MSKRLDLRRVLARAGLVNRARWPVLAGLVIALDWLPTSLNDLRATKPLGHGSWADAEWAVRDGVFMLLLILSWVRTVLITQVALQDPRQPSSARVILRGLSAFPVLLPVLFWTGGVICVAMIGQALVAFGVAAVPQFFQYSQIALAVVALVYLLLLVLVGVFVPTALAERLDFASTFRRSAGLMGGNRLAFVGMYVALQIGDLIVSQAGRGSFERARGAVGVQRLAVEAPELISQLTMSVLFAGWLVVVAASYRELRRIHDEQPDEIAEAFA